MNFENLFRVGASMRIALGIIFALFILCFIVIFVEETFLGGRRRRKAVKDARERMIAAEAAHSLTADPAPQNSHTHHPRQ